MPPLVKSLEDKSIVVQLTCLDALARMKADVTLSQLKHLLDNTPLRSGLYNLMANSSDESVIDILVEGLTARSRQERSSAACALVQQYRQVQAQKKVDMRISVSRVASDAQVNQLKELLQRDLLEYLLI